MAPEAWRGALPITYHVGPGPAKVHLKLKFNWDSKPLYDVIARIPGIAISGRMGYSRQSSRRVGQRRGRSAFRRGGDARRDARAWRAAEARLEAEAHHLFCFWDGEEPGLLGSTEWAETHADELQKHAVAYMNSDGNGRGFLAARSHTLEKFVNGVERDIEDPDEADVGGSGCIAARRAPARARTRSRRASAQEQSPEFPIGALGSGSDYSAFSTTSASRRSTWVSAGRSRRRLPLHLRRFLLVHALRRHRFRLRPRARADGGTR